MVHELLAVCIWRLREIYVENRREREEIANLVFVFESWDPQSGLCQFLLIRNQKRHQALS